MISPTLDESRFWLLIIFLTVFATPIVAQDLIILHSKDTLQAKILEVTPENFKYEIAHEDGNPVTISLSRNDVTYYVYNDYWTSTPPERIEGVTQQNLHSKSPQLTSFA